MKLATTVGPYLFIYSSPARMMVSLLVIIPVCWSLQLYLLVLKRVDIIMSQIDMIMFPPLLIIHSLMNILVFNKNNLCSFNCDQQSIPRSQSPPRYLNIYFAFSYFQRIYKLTGKSSV